MVPPQPQLLQQKDELKEKRGGLVGLFEKVIGDFLPGLSRRKRHSGDDGRSRKVKDECQLEGRSGKIMGEVLAATRDMLNLWVHLESMEKVDWCSQVKQAAERGNWARFLIFGSIYLLSLRNSISIVQCENVKIWSSRISNI